jgi:hypothetical protein
MRWLAVPVVLSAACAAACVPEPPPANTSRVAYERARPVRSWVIVTNGDQPPSCDERLATDGVGLEEDALGVPFEVIHLAENDTLELATLSYAIDGRCVFSWSRDPESDAAPNQLNIARGDVAPGEHQVSFVASFEPARHGDYDMRFEVQSGYTVDLDGPLRLFATSYERGQASLDRRLAVRFELGTMKPPPVVVRPR